VNKRRYFPRRQLASVLKNSYRELTALGDETCEAFFWFLRSVVGKLKHDGEITVGTHDFLMQVLSRCFLILEATTVELNPLSEHIFYNVMK